MKKLLSLIFLLTLFCCGCYRMPDEGEVSMVPNVNNPKYSSSQKNPAAIVTPSFDY